MKPAQPSDSQSVGRRRRRWPRVLLVLALAVLGVALLWDWNWFKPLVEARVQAATGREFRIEGDLDVDPGRRALVRMDRVVLGNAQWSPRPTMLEIDNVSFALEVGPLLRGRYLVPWLRFERPQLLLERSDDGRANWRFDDESEPEGEDERRLSIERVEIVEGRLRVIEPQLQTDADFAVRSDPAGGDDALVAEGSGTYRGEPFELEARASGLARFAAAPSEEAGTAVSAPAGAAVATAAPYRLQATARAAETVARIDGPLAMPPDLERFSVRLELEGPDARRLSKLFATPLPATPAYRVGGLLERDGAHWRYREFDGSIGESDLAGDLSVDRSADRPRLSARLHSRRMHLDSLMAIFGEERKAPRERAGDSARVFPETPFGLDGLRSMDAELRLHAERVVTAKLPLDAIDAQLRLEDGRLKLAPLRLGVAGGRVEGEVLFDGAKKVPALSMNLSARGLDLPRLFPGVKTMKGSTGRISGRARLAGQGASIAALAGSADGELALAMGKGAISNLALEFVGLDIAESLRFLAGKDRMITLRCAWTSLEVRGGGIDVRAFVFDTTDTLLRAEGSADLRRESLALKIVPQPKDPSPMSVRTPLNIAGTFSKPTVTPDATPLLLRGAAAVALAAIAPPAALLAFIETGPGEDADCAQATRIDAGTQRKKGTR